MKLINRRLRRLEEQTAIHEVWPTWVYDLAERQRRRAEANGVAYEPWHDPTLRNNATWAEVLASHQRHRAELRELERLRKPLGTTE